MNNQNNSDFHSEYQKSLLLFYTEISRREGKSNPKTNQSELGFVFKNVEISLEFLHLIQTLKASFYQSQRNQRCLNLGISIVDWLKKITTSSTQCEGNPC